MKLTARFKERFYKTLKKHSGRVVGFQNDEIILPDGKHAQREFMTHYGAVGALAIEPGGKILLVKQFRYPVHEFTLEIPAGKLSKGEDPLDCVHRELEEETGYKAGKISKLLEFWPTAAFSTEVIHLYEASKLIETKMNPDEDEFLELVYMRPAELERMIYAGTIHDSKTLIAFLAWKNKQ